MSGPRAPSSRRLPSRRFGGGFTLPEVLTAMTLVAIVLPVALRGISLALNVSADARRKVEATALAETQLATMTAEVMANAALPAGAQAGDFGPEYPLYRWEASAVLVETDLTELQVKVLWQSRGQDRSVILSTLVFTNNSGAAAASGLTGSAGGTGTGTGATGGAR
jgi:prepilin-type N-terminal cleavage/methylation domain-containing protein